MSILGKVVKCIFGPATCRDATYDCRVKKQYVQIIYETNTSLGSCSMESMRNF